MSIKPLTASEVKNARPREKDYSLHDGFGLLLYVSKAGGKSWRYRYPHPVTKRRQTYTIGRFPYFTLTEAREVREELRRMLSRGVDPSEHRNEKRAEVRAKHLQNVKSVALNWLELKMGSQLRQSTKDTIEFIVKRHIIPLIGHENINTIKAPGVIHSLGKYNDRPAIQMKIISKLNEIMNYCVNIGLISGNPLSKIKKAFAVKKDTPLAALPLEQLPAFLVWWDGHDYVAMKNSLLFQILTMVRPREAREARWAEINVQNKEWIIPAERMKTGREHVVPLSSQAMFILNEMRKHKYGEFVFYSDRKPQQAISKALRHKYFLEGPFAGVATAHGFRAMWSTLLNEEGFNPDVIEAALAHKNSDAIRGVYNRTTYFEQRKIVMQWIGDFIDSARKGIVKRSNGFKGLKVVND
ncbi:tyrosine-type recombinase/integrase [Buttiauxella selenatireducens]|uniref:Tyrosine-type recombinase/integrase n=1 Tax=Buttiauxella selenatireducens TaxID=3073902 RepID=A0ABY9S9J0_9ENTR|nr:integrase arm-type DNA-binding domain-containing protein [Buttiauxella sp. R73]WMY72742.1 tyrosine-type recombinase/integrase [Buttiauxella sp. R73]